MKNISLKTISTLFLIGTFIFAICVNSVFSQRKNTRRVSKQTQINRLIMKGMKQVENNQMEAAAETFTQCIALKPTLKNAYFCYFGRGTAYFVLQKFEEAIPDLTKSYESILDMPSRYLRGRSYVELQNYEKALEDFNFFILMYDPDKIKTEYPEVYQYRGLALVAKRDLDKAIADYTKALEFKPKAAEIFYARGLAYFMKDDLENAEIDLKKALKLDQNLKADIEVYFERIAERKAFLETN